MTVASVCGTTAQAAPPELKRAQNLAHRFEYDRALALLDDLLERTTLARKDRIGALLLRGRILVGFGCNEKAIANYHALLTLERGIELDPMESPKVRGCIEAARRARPAPTPPPGRPPGRRSWR